MTPEPDPELLLSLAAQRRALRATLLAARSALATDTRAGFDARILDQLGTHLHATPAACIGAYWPMRAEPDLRAAMHAWHASGIVVALPLVVAPDQPLRFVRWTPHAVVEEHRMGARLAGNTEPVQPELLLIPCVGFDERCYRLGYGGGFYDRTLAAQTTRNWGVAYDCCRIDRLDVQGHDHALDAVFTESRVW